MRDEKRLDFSFRSLAMIKSMKAEVLSSNILTVTFKRQRLLEVRSLRHGP